MIIIGAGLSGLLAANIFRKQDPIVFEKQTTLPNNHKALLRFRTAKVSQSTGILFECVTVNKQINYKGQIYNQANIKLSNEYAYKVSGEYKTRSIINLDTVERYIAPENLIEQMALGCRIWYDEEKDYNYFKDKSDVVISTIPMYDLMKILGWQNIPEFNYRSIWSVVFDIEDPRTKLYQTTYYPNLELDLYRMSITGNKVIAEFISDPDRFFQYKNEEITLEEYIFHFLINDFGVEPINHSDFKISHQKYGKLVESDRRVCKSFISWATKEFNIYSLGRWGLHRQILMDDVVDDIFTIDKLIRTDNYGVIKK